MPETDPPPSKSAQADGSLRYGQPKIFSSKPVWIAAVLFAVVPILITTVIVNVIDWRESRRTGSCASHLLQMGLAMKMYAIESRGEMHPPLSTVPGRLMFGKAVVSEYLWDAGVHFCPSAFDFEEMGKRQLEWRTLRDAGISDNPMIDDWSYFYLSYVLLSDEDVEDFANFYKARVEAGESVDGDIPLMRNGEQVVRTLPVDNSFSPGVKIQYDRLYRLRYGVGEELLKEPSERDSMVLQSRIPVMIERPGNHQGRGKNTKDGCNVLFNDLHVEYMKYPGEWPMTEKTMGLLLELDALGAQ